MKIISSSAWKRFWAKVDKGSRPGGCWLWLGGITRGKKNGTLKYGYFDLGVGYRTTAHRALWIMVHGGKDIGDRKLGVRHTCDVPLCVNPDHLWLGTGQEDADDKVRKGRQCKGDKHWTRLHPELRTVWEHSAKTKQLLSRLAKLRAAAHPEHMEKMTIAAVKVMTGGKRDGLRGKFISKGTAA